jgi:hypothetical protein
MWIHSWTCNAGLVLWLIWMKDNVGTKLRTMDLKLCPLIDEVHLRRRGSVDGFSRHPSTPVNYMCGVEETDLVLIMAFDLDLSKNQHLIIMQKVWVKIAFVLIQRNRRQILCLKSRSDCLTDLGTAVCQTVSTWVTGSNRLNFPFPNWSNTLKSALLDHHVTLEVFSEYNSLITPRITVNWNPFGISMERFITRWSILWNQK